MLNRIDTFATKRECPSRVPSILASEKRNCRTCNDREDRITNAENRYDRSSQAFSPPPLPEQKRIAAILKEQLAAVDEARAAAEAQLEAARALPAAYLREVFDSEEAKGWPQYGLGEIAAIQLGKMLSPKSKQGDVPQPYLRNVNVQWNRFDLTEVLRMDFSTKEREKFALRKNDILVCEGGEPGRAAIWNVELKPCYYQKALHRIRPKQSLAIPKFILYRLWYAASKNEFIDSHAKTTIAHLPLVRLKKLSIQIPNISKQENLTSWLEEKMDSTERAIKLCKENLADVTALSGAMLRKAFSGEL